MIDIIVEGKYQAKKYSITGLQRYDLGDADIIASSDTDDPKRAIKAWCAATAKSHGDADIFAESKDAACELIDWAYDNKDVVESLMSAVSGFPYKHEYILNAIDEKHEDRCRFFYNGPGGYPDAVYPFCAG